NRCQGIWRASLGNQTPHESGALPILRSMVFSSCARAWRRIQGLLSNRSHKRPRLWAYHSPQARTLVATVNKTSLVLALAVAPRELGIPEEQGVPCGAGPVNSNSAGGKP